MILPIPIFYKGNKYSNVEFDIPTADTLANVSDAIEQQGNVFQANRIFLIGCITQIDDIIDKNELKILISKIPSKSAEYLIIQILLKAKPEMDKISGVYSHICGNKIISDYKFDDGIEIDTRDSISSLKVNYYKDDVNEIEIIFSEPLQIKDNETNEVIENILSMTFQFPTIEHCINAFQKKGGNSNTRLQYAIYLEALIKVNGNDLANNYKHIYGDMAIKKINIVDLEKLAKKINFYGINPVIEKFCPHCGVNFKALINTSNFFVSALQS